MKEIKRFLLRFFLYLIPTTLVWWLALPFYNHFLIKATERVIRFTEDPPVTKLLIFGKHQFLVTRSDYSTPRGYIRSYWATNVHFHLLLLIPLCLATDPKKYPLSYRIEAVLWVIIASAFFHIILLFLKVKFVYATQLGEWSANNYSLIAQNLYGITKHVMDLAIKFAWPLALWVLFFPEIIFGGNRDEKV